MIRYDYDNKRLVIREIPLIRSDYLALSKFFGENLDYVIHKNQSKRRSKIRVAGDNDGPLEKAYIGFSEGRVDSIHMEDYVVNTENLGNLFNDLDGLKRIYFNNCRLVYIPNETYYLTSLESLGIINDSINKISPKIKNLRNLEELSLERNPFLKNLPNEILELKKLKNVRLYETSIELENPIIKELKEKNTGYFII